MKSKKVIHWPVWNLSSKNRVTPVSIQDGVQHGITFAAISTIPAAPSPILRSYRRFCGVIAEFCGVIADP